MTDEDTFIAAIRANPQDDLTAQQRDAAHETVRVESLRDRHRAAEQALADMEREDET